MSKPLPVGTYGYLSRSYIGVGPAGTRVRKTFDDGSDFGQWGLPEDYERALPFGRRALMEVRSVYWIQDDEVGNPFVEPSVEREPVAAPTLTLKHATFEDEHGNKVQVKRSKCRHYYVRVGSSNQERVTLDDIKSVVNKL